MRLLGLFLIALLYPAIGMAQGSPDIWLLAANGSVKGVTPVSLYGLNGAIPATFETVWPESAVYTPGVAALSAPYCASSSADDDAAGTGLRTMTVGGLNTSYARWSETVTMDGQTSVVLATTDILLIDTMVGLTAGSGGLNAGVVQCGTGTNTAGDPAVTHSYLSISSITAVAGAGNTSQSFIYGVPASNKLICRNISAGSVFATAASSLQIAIDGYTNLGIMKRYFEQTANNAGANPSLFPGFVVFPEKTLIIGKLAGPTGSNVGPADLRADCLLIDSTTANTPLI